MNRRLHILQVVEATFDGVGRHVLDLSAHLIEHDHRVDLVWCPDRSEERFVDRLDSLNMGEVLELPPGTSGWAGIPRVGRSLSPFVDANGPYDIIHGHSSRGGAWARLLPNPAKRIYTPNALITQAAEIGALRRRAFAAIERLLALRTDGMIFVSPEEKSHAEAIGLKPRMTATIPNGIELVDLPSRQAARAALGLEQDDLIFGSIGRLVSQKGHDRLLAAFALYVDRGGEGLLVIIGEGPEEDNLRRQAQELGIAERVRFLGRRPGQDSMPAFDVFALASRYEGFPYVLLEAMWAGLPVIISDRASVSAIVDNGVNAIACAPDPEPFADAIGRVAQSRQLRESLGKQANQTVRHHSIKTMAEATVAFYQQVLSAEVPATDPGDQ